MSRLVRSVMAGAVASVVAAIPAAGVAPVSQVPVWQWPVDAPRSVVRPYVAPATPYAAGHRGVDLRATDGGTVYAPADGVVHFSGFVVDRPVLSLRHPGGLISSFEPVESALASGTAVLRGDVVGIVLAGHCVPVVCVHVGVRLDGEYVSPLLYLGEVPRSVLLPTRPLSASARLR